MKVLVFFYRNETLLFVSIIFMAFHAHISIVNSIERNRIMLFFLNA